MNCKINTVGKFLVVLGLLALAGCQTASPAAPEPVPVFKPKVIDSACSWTQVITVTKDRLTDAAASTIIAQLDADLKAAQLPPKQILTKAVRATGQDFLTPETARQVKGHDDAWVQNCKK